MIHTMSLTRLRQHLVVFTLFTSAFLILLTVWNNSSSLHDSNRTQGQSIREYSTNNLQWVYSPWEQKRRMRYRPNCTALLNGDLQEAKRVTDLLKADPYQPVSTNEVGKWASNCTAYRRFINFRNAFITQEEKEFPLAFSLRMHHAVEQAEHLLRHIYAPQNLYCIYIDKNSPAEVHDAMKQIASCFQNVFIATRLEEFYYSTTSHVRADMQCMHDSYRMDIKWKYFINLVGEEFPIKTNLNLVRMLKMLNGSNGIESRKFTDKEMDFKLHGVHKVINGTNTRIPGLRRIPFPLGESLIRKGDEYGFFSHSFVEWVLTAIYPRRLLAYYHSGTWGSDEFYWATLNRHPDAPGGYLYDVPRFSKARIWLLPGYKGRQRDYYPCRGPVIRYICMLTVLELPWLMRQQEPFANKFKIDVDPLATDCLAEMLTEKRLTGAKDDLAFFRYNPVVYDKVFYKDSEQHSDLSEKQWWNQMAGPRPKKFSVG